MRNLKVRDNLENLEVRVRTILESIVFAYIDWTQQAQDWDTWRALVNTVMKLRVS
jgi:hypothetical protein